MFKDLFSLQGRVALVTGGSRGIGKMIAGGFLAQGAAKVYITARKAGPCEATAKELTAEYGGECIALPIDISGMAGIDMLASEIKKREPKLDILVNNAGIGSRQPIETVAPDDFERMIAINLRAPFFVMQQALPRLVDGGRIVNISSTAARISYGETPLYAATKAALQSLTLSTAKRLGPRGITVNAVAPGATRTDLNPLARDPESAKQIASETILGRVGEPEDIADVVAFLASDQAHWITGQVIEASGGLRL
jgi:3-oxoacyl-[acyl-carrier protein] reductase